MRKKIAVLTGAGVSAESGFATFRDTGGLWEQFDVNDVASIEGWYRNRKLVLDFYNQRRAQLKDAKPNAAHYAIAGLEKDYTVDVITQNVDNLHERAGSTRVLHLHGELTKVRPENGIYRQPVTAAHRLFRRGRPEHRAGHHAGGEGRYPPDRGHFPAGLSGRRPVPLCRPGGSHLHHRPQGCSRS